MFDNQNYPWYIQQSPICKKLYDGFFPIVSYASPLALSDVFNVDQITGTGLLNFGRMWGLRGTWGGTTDGLIYNIDSWSTDRVWSGEMKDIDAQIYRNFIRMKAYINGRDYSLITLQEAMKILLSDVEFEMWVDEGFMTFTINVKADGLVLNRLYNLSQYDTHFLGKPTGISYKFNFINLNQGAQE